MQEKLDKKLFSTNKKFVFFFNCSNGEKFAEKIRQTNWWKHLINSLFTLFFSAVCKRINKCLDGNPSKETNSENWQKCALQCFNDINGECFNWSFFEGKCSLFNEETRTEITKSGCVNGAWNCYEWKVPTKLFNVFYPQ